MCHRDKHCRQRETDCDWVWVIALPPILKGQLQRNSIAQAPSLLKKDFIQWTTSGSIGIECLKRSGAFGQSPGQRIVVELLMPKLVT